MSDADAAQQASALLYGSNASNLSSSLWGQASADFVSSLSGDVTVIASSANQARIFAQVEVPAALDNPDITTLAGQTIDSLQSQIAAGSFDLLSTLQTHFRSILSNGGVLIQNAGGTGTIALSQEALTSLGASGESALTSAALESAGYEVLSSATSFAAEVLGTAGKVALGLLGTAVGGAIIDILTSATPVNAGEDQALAANSNFGADLPDGAGPSIFKQNANGSSTVSIPLYNTDGSLVSNFALNVNSSQTEVSGAVTYNDPGGPGGVGTTTSLFDSTAGSASIGQISSSQGQTQGQYFITYSADNQTTTLGGTSLDTTQVTPNGDGSFTFGSPQADADGIVTQLTVSGTFGTSTLTITDPATGPSTTIPSSGTDGNTGGITIIVPLNNDTNTTVYEGRSAATDAPTEEIKSTSADGAFDSIELKDGIESKVQYNAAGQETSSQTLSFDPQGIETAQSSGRPPSSGPGVMLVHRRPEGPPVSPPL